ncbi:MAG: glucuronosyltransferase [Candidatus Zixiibacteriota bacterium]|nr:MAG: glucuronosyltransferase [candidate division Zixibacteria bacterium]
MKRAVLITGHYYGSKRRAGFHWIADALVRAGWEVLFFTSSLSWLSVLRRDYRLDYPVRREAGTIKSIGQNLSSFVWFTPYHPANLRLPLVNKLSSRLFNSYGNLDLGQAEEVIAGSDLFIFESMPGLLLFERFKRLNPGARFVYRASDDLRSLRVHPLVITTEEEILPRFDLVSVPSWYIYGIFEGHPNLELQPHGIQKDLFDRKYPNPYRDSNGPNIVFVGASYFDRDFLERASQLFPHCHFHMIGPIPDLPRRGNVTGYGEMPFERTVPYIKYADLGLQMRRYVPGLESLTDSLKVLQYTYCQLPVIAPGFLRCHHKHMLYYEPGNDRSIGEAIFRGLNYDRSSISPRVVSSWDDLAAALIGEEK